MRKICFYFVLLLAVVLSVTLCCTAETVEILSISKIIDPESAACDDCNFTLKIKKEDNSEAILVLPLFEKRVFLSSSSLKVGDKITYESVTPTEELKSRSISDDFSDEYKLPKIWAKKFILVRANWPQMDLVPIINEELAACQKLLDTVRPVPESVRVQWEELVPKIENFEAVATYDDCVYTLNKFHMLSIPGFLDRNSYSTSALQHIIEFDEICKKQGRQLVVLPVPEAVELSFPAFFGADSDVEVVNPGRLELIRDLLQAGIPAFDLLPTLRKGQIPGSFVYQDMNFDGHFSSLGYYIISDYITEKLGLKVPYPKILKQEDGYKKHEALSTYDMPQKIVAVKSYLGRELENPIYVCGDSFAVTDDLFRHMLGALLDCSPSTAEGFHAGFERNLFVFAERKMKTNQEKYVFLIFFSVYVHNNVETLLSRKINRTIKRKAVETNPQSKSGGMVNFPLTCNADSTTEFEFSLPQEKLESKYFVRLHITPRVARFRIFTDEQLLFRYENYWIHGNSSPYFIFAVDSASSKDGKVSIRIENGKYPITINEFKLLPGSAVSF